MINSVEQHSSNNKRRKLVIIVAIILLTTLIVFLLNAFKPEAKKREIPETVVRVDVIKTKRDSYPIVVNANGTIEAITRGNLVAQVRGEIIEVAEQFKEGGSFKKGDLLVKVDQRDYVASLSQASATLSQAQVNYRQEQANAKQAAKDWQRLGNTGEAPPLVLRKPQMVAAKAQLDSAKAAYATAKLNLERTVIQAPYDGRIIRRNVVLGQYVSVGTPIAEVYANDGVEVRLPISQDEYNQLGLNALNTSNAPQFEVTLSSNIGQQEYRWPAKISRVDSTFDINTRQINVFAEVIKPFDPSGSKPSLKIGQFVNAYIKGQKVDNVFVLPNKSIREGSYVYIVRDQHLAKKNINILWQDDQNTLVKTGLDEGEVVVTTSLNSTLAGARAKLSDEPETKPDDNAKTDSKS